MHKCASRCRKRIQTSRHFVYISKVCRDVDAKFHTFYSLDTKLRGASLNVVAKTEIPPTPAVNQTQVVQPVASHFIPSAIPDHGGEEFNQYYKFELRK
jgi:hypothetical protein